MPRLGLGTWKSPPNKAGQAVSYALLESAYLHIDCAAIYGNEAEIGQALHTVFMGKRVARDQVFITSKLWNTMHAANDVAKACKKTLRDLRLDYLDLYLMHWSVPQSPVSVASNFLGSGVLWTPKIPVRETWEAMEALVALGLVKAIGAANFTGPLLVDLLSYAKIKPAVNQIELHPYNQQTNLVTFCHNQGIAVTAYSPLGTPGNIQDKPGQPILLQEPAVIKIAGAHKKSPAQVLIRWGIQRNTIVIPKSITPERIKENSEVFDFELSKSETDTLTALERRLRFVDLYDWTGIPYF